jgi:hypothetical protein
LGTHTTIATSLPVSPSSTASARSSMSVYVMG